MPGLTGYNDAKKENGDHSDQLDVLIFSIGNKGNLGYEVQWIPFGWLSLGGERLLTVEIRYYEGCWSEGILLIRSFRQHDSFR